MQGRAVPLSLPRRLICDLMHFASGVPTVPVQRRMNLAPVLAARQSCADRPPWTGIFAKAFAVVANEFPPLRRAYCKFPWPHFYQYPASIASIAIEREWKGEPVVLALPVKDPARKPLSEIAQAIRHGVATPVESVARFRRIIQMTRWPRPIRRTLWWLALNVGRWRGHHFGTFGISVYSALGAESLHPLSPLTATLNYGVISNDGTVDVRIVYDHRVLDGSTVGRALARLEEVLNTLLRDELITLPPAAGNRAA